MRIPRFYINPEIHKIPDVGNQMQLPDTVAHHLVHVLRTVVDSPIILIDGTGDEYQGSVQEINKKHTIILIKQKNKVSRESPVETVLAQAVVTGAKMDMVIQKAVELGVNKIIPVLTDRCKVQLKKDRAAARLKHWQGVIESACEQSGRTRLPELAKITNLFPWAEKTDSDTKIVLQPDSKVTIGGIAKPKTQVLVLIGPEGGFTEDELAGLQAAGFTGVRLGARILRTETAGSAALAAIQMQWGDF